MRQAHEPEGELLEHRPVEAELLAHLGNGLGGGVLAGDDGGRIARRQTQQDEYEHRDDHHDRDGGEQPAQDIGGHRPTSW